MKDKKGFTLAELLIVVAIIGVLVAISIPIFTSQLKKARLATNQANARAAYAAVAAELLDSGKDAGSDTYTVSTAKTTGTIGPDSELTIKTAIADWSEGDYGSKVATAWKVNIAADGTVTFEGTGLS